MRLDFICGSLGEAAEGYIEQTKGCLKAELYCNYVNVIRGVTRGRSPDTKPRTFEKQTLTSSKRPPARRAGVGYVRQGDGGAVRVRNPSTHACMS
jgi:hypothetical protein